MDVMRSEYRELGVGELEQVRVVKHLAEGLHHALESLGASRELSLAKTKLEECVMWGVKHITGAKAAELSIGQRITERLREEAEDEEEERERGGFDE